MDDTTILFTDIEGSTRWVERLGDDRWLDVLHQHNDIVRAQLYAHGGREVKTQGDGFLVTFASAADAVRCAGAIQRSMNFVANNHAGGGLRVRIGADCGDVAEDGDDVVGLHVNLASRITDAARAGEVLVSASVREGCEDAPDLRWGRTRTVRVRGLNRHLRVSAAEWRPQPVRTAAPRAAFRPALAHTWLL